MLLVDVVVLVSWCVRISDCVVSSDREIDGGRCVFGDMNGEELTMLMREREREGVSEGDSEREVV